MEGYGYNQAYGASTAPGSAQPAPGMGTGPGETGAGAGAAPLPGNRPPAPQNWDAPPPRKPSENFRELMGKYAHETLAYCSVFWSFGMCVAFLGPTLLDLGCLTSTDMKTISWVFFSQLLCSLIGSTMAGYMAQRIDANLVLTIATTILPVVMFVIPFCKVLAALGLVLAIMGLNMGVIDCLANLQMIKTFGENVPPFLQALHFFYGLGAFVSPMIAEPFLLNEDCTPFIDNNTSPTPAPGSPYINATLPAATLEEAQEMTQVKFAFWILCALQLPIPVIMGSLLMRMRWRGLHKGHRVLGESENSLAAGTKKSEYESIDKEQKGPAWPPASQLSQPDPPESNGLFGTTSFHIIAITVATGAMTFIYDGLQSAYGGYVYSYAVKSIIDLNKTEGAYLNACFWGMFALGRLLSIFVATRFAPIFMLLCNIIGCFLSMILMLSLQHDHIALYIGTCAFGLFLSSVTPTALSLAEQYIDVTSSITTFVVVIAAMGEMIFPVIVGNVFVTLGPASFLGFGNIACLISLFVFGIIWVVGRQTPKAKAAGPGSFIWARVCCLRRPQADMTAEDGLVTTHVKYYSSRTPPSNSNIELASVPQSNGQPGPGPVRGVESAGFGFRE